MSDDAELLRDYANGRGEAAFAELIRRHVDVVYSAALRLMNGNGHAAEDVTQQVFTELARQARRLAGHPALVGWLYTTTRRVALRAIRTEKRRSTREQEARRMNELLQESAPEPDWEHLSPLLEEVMHELAEKDRVAILLRFFQNKSLKDVGEALGVGENAARMRVDRALEKLRLTLVRRGLAPGAGLAAVISANAVQLAPANLTAALAATSTVAAGTGAMTLLKIMTATHIKIGLGTLAVAGALAALVMQHQAQARLRQENDLLRERVAKVETANAGLSNQLASTQAAEAVPENDQNELLRLRGEVGRLKNQLAEAVKEEAPKPKDVKALPTDAETQERKLAERRLVGAKTLTSAIFFGYAEHHHDEMPTNWNQVASYFDQWERMGLNPGDAMPDTAADFAEMTNEFDLVYQGLTTAVTNPWDILVVKEKQAWQAASGRMVKTYGFADGHSQIVAEPPEGFDVYEQQHMLPPAGQ